MFCLMHLLNIILLVLVVVDVVVACVRARVCVCVCHAQIQERDWGSRPPWKIKVIWVSLANKQLGFSRE